MTYWIAFAALKFKIAKQTHFFFLRCNSIVKKHTNMKPSETGKFRILTSTAQQDSICSSNIYIITSPPLLPICLNISVNYP